MKSLMISLGLLCLATGFQPPQPLFVLKVGQRLHRQSLKIIQYRPQPTTLEAMPGIDIDVDFVFGQVDQIWKAFPYPAAAVVCGVKASAADLVAQSSAAASASSSDDAVHSDTKEETDFRRNLSFLIYGALYQGIAHEYIFNHLYPIWFGTGTDFVCVASKVLFNLLIQTTLVTLPVGYLIQSIVKEETVEMAFGHYRHDIMHKHLLLKCFMIWGPVQSFTFSVVPEHLRVSFVAVVSFFWLILFSAISNDEETVSSATMSAPHEQ